MTGISKNAVFTKPPICEGSYFNFFRFFKGKRLAKIGGITKYRKITFFAEKVPVPAPLVIKLAISEAVLFVSR